MFLRSVRRERDWVFVLESDIPKSPCARLGD